MKQPPKFYEKEYGRNNVFQIFTRLMSNKIWFFFCLILVLGIVGTGLYLYWDRDPFPELNAGDYDCAIVTVQTAAAGTDFYLREPEQIESLLQSVSAEAGRELRFSAPGLKQEYLIVRLYRDGSETARLFLQEGRIQLLREGWTSSGFGWDLDAAGMQALTALVQTDAPRAFPTPEPGKLQQVELLYYGQSRGLLTQAEIEDLCAALQALNEAPAENVTWNQGRTAWVAQPNYTLVMTDSDGTQIELNRALWRGTARYTLLDDAPVAAVWELPETDDPFAALTFLK